MDKKVISAITIIGGIAIAGWVEATINSKRYWEEKRKRMLGEIDLRQFVAFVHSRRWRDGLLPSDESTIDKADELYQEFYIQ